MADYSITITNTLGVFAGTNVNKWGAFEWGNDQWGYINDVITEVGKIIAETTTPTTSLTKDITKLITDTATLTDIVFMHTERTTTETTTLTSSLPTITLVDSNGYFIVFKGDTTNASNRVLSSYSEISTSDSGWSEVTTPSTTWS